MRAFVLALALGCGGSSPPPPAQPSPLAGETRCKQALDHIDELHDGGGDPEQRTARLQAIQQARAAGILGDDRTPDCVKRWTTANVDCILAATEVAASEACVPPK